MGPGAEGTKSSEIPPGRPKIRILGPKCGFSFKTVVFCKRNLMKFRPLSKSENVLFAPGDRLYNPRFFVRFHHQKLVLRGPYGRNPHHRPPNFIDFRPTTAHARILPLPISGWSGRSGQGGLGGLGDLGGQGLGLGLGGLGLGG